MSALVPGTRTGRYRHGRYAEQPERDSVNLALCDGDHITLRQECSRVEQPLLLARRPVVLAVGGLRWQLAELDADHMTRGAEVGDGKASDEPLEPRYRAIRDVAEPVALHGPCGVDSPSRQILCRWTSSRQVRLEDRLSLIHI